MGHASVFSLEDLLVKIEVSKGVNKQETYGFIYAAKDKILTVVTVCNPFAAIDDQDQTIRVFLRHEISPILATLLVSDREINIAVLQLPMPENFTWPGRIRSREPEVKDIVFIFNRFGNVEELTERTAGYVNQVNPNNTFEIVSTSDDMGNPGSLVIKNQEIIGLTTHDMGERVIAVPNKLFHYMLMERLGIDHNNYLIGSPNLLIGGKLDCPFYTSQVFRKYTMSTYPYGVFAEAGILRNLSIRFEYEFGYSVSSKLLPINNQYTQSKTDLRGYAVYLVYKEGSLTGERLNTYVSLGFSRMQQQLYLKINSDTWEHYETYLTTDETIPGYCNFLLIKGTSRLFVSDYLVIDFNFGFKISDNNHKIIDLFNHAMEINRLSLFGGIDIGVLLFNRNCFRNYVY